MKTVRTLLFIWHMSISLLFLCQSYFDLLLLSLFSWMKNFVWMNELNKLCTYIYMKCKVHPKECFFIKKCMRYNSIIEYVVQIFYIRTPRGNSTREIRRSKSYGFFCYLYGLRLLDCTFFLNKKSALWIIQQHIHFFFTFTIHNNSRILHFWANKNG